MSWTTARDRTPERRRDAPRRVPGGIKLRPIDEERSRHPVTAAWIALLDSAASSEQEEGRSYAESGQTVSLELSPGRIDARVQGRAAKPYVTTLRLPMIEAQQWDKLIDAMAGEAIYVAKLLDGELPERTGELFRSCGVEPLPQQWDEVTVECGCGARGTCKHIVATALLVADRLEAQPLLMFTLRGCDGDHLVDRLVQARAIRTHGVAAAHFDPFIPESQNPMVPLEACLDEYWRAGTARACDEPGGAAPHVQHALLRRLGPSPLKGRFPMVGLLASIYDAVAASITELRERSDR